MPIINQIVKGSGGGGSSTKLGLSIDNLIGDVDGNGVLQPVSQKISSIDLTGVVELGGGWWLFAGRGSGSANAFDTNGCTISAPDLETITSANHMFYYNYYISSVSFPKLKTIGNSACADMFALTQESSIGLLTSIDLSTVETIGDYGCENMFYGRRTLTTVNLSGVKTIGAYGLSKAFQYTGLTSISFDALTTVGSNAFGGTTAANAFRSCSSLTAIHFPAAMQSAIESQAGYGNKWGASNATIYFDL